MKYNHYQEIVDFAALVYDINDFYKSSGVILVASRDILNENWACQKIALNLIKQFSYHSITSIYMDIDYFSFKNVMKLESEISQTPSKEPLIVLYIDEKKTLTKFQFLKGHELSIFPWFVIFGNRINIDCKNPQGNPFSLQMNTRMMVLCQNHVYIKKYYAILANTTEVVDLATWKPGEHVVFQNDDNLLQVRKNMKGITLRIAKHNHSSIERNKNVEDYLENVLKALENVSNFKTDTVIQTDALGHFHNNRWTGLVGTLAYKQVDLALALLSMSSQRQIDIDFPMPFFQTQIKIYAKKPKTTSIQWSAFFKVFHLQAWIALALLLLLITLLLTLIKSYFKNKSVTMNLFFENLVNVWGIYCQQGLAENPFNIPIQAIYLSALVLSLIVFSIYSATITSYITVLKTNLPFSTYEEFVEDKNYKLVVLKDSRDQTLMDKGDWLLKPLKDRIKKYEELPTNPYDGFEQACEDNVAFYSDEVMFDGISLNTKCVLKSLNMPRKENQAIALVKNSPYTETFNY
ncbi:glutamate receptor ionotropic, delta-1-like [Nasonia vitripennis]|uniref:Uncharacterized protein n=1 Tax=Nasonia vitripennis TaxID=7425 RepID=A0A7M7T7H4_NASVI|nr:glutamate receptor ionotropic, delta-1-like [Nasonia vitripennis]